MPGVQEISGPDLAIQVVMQVNIPKRIQKPRRYSISEKKKTLHSETFRPQMLGI